MRAAKAFPTVNKSITLQKEYGHGVAEDKLEGE
jgi:hypothetical protein